VLVNFLEYFQEQKNSYPPAALFFAYNDTIDTTFYFDDLFLNVVEADCLCESNIPFDIAKFSGLLASSFTISKVAPVDIIPILVLLVEVYFLVYKQ